MRTTLNTICTIITIPLGHIQMQILNAIFTVKKDIYIAIVLERDNLIDNKV